MENDLIELMKEKGIKDPLQKRFVYKFKDSEELGEFQFEMKSKGWKTWVSDQFYPEWSYHGMVLEPEERHIIQMIKTPSGTEYSEGYLIDCLRYRKLEFGNKEDIEINKAIGLLISQKLLNYNNPTINSVVSNWDR